MAKNPTVASLLARIQELEAASKAKKTAPPVTLKVSPKGGISVYGLGRFPLTQYASQMEKLGEKAFGLSAAQFATTPIGQFIKVNADKLSRKPEAAA
jgi:hypothetical protein